MSSQSGDLDQALYFHRAGILARAQQIYRQILQSDPNHPDALHLLGLSLIDTGDPKQAAELMGRAIALSPANANYHLDQGHAFRALGDLAQAQHYFERALALQPNFVSAHLCVGLVKMQQGDLDAGEFHFQEALRLEPDSAYGWNSLGNLFITRANWNQAQECLEQAIRLAPTYAEAQNGLGTVWHRKGDLKRARECFEQALALQPLYATALYNLGVVCHEARDFDMAQRYFRQAIQTRPHFYEAYYQWAAVLNDREQYSEAEDCLQRALQIQPDFVPAVCMLAVCLEFQGKTEAAREQLAKAQSIHQTDDAALRSALLLPIIYDSTAQIAHERERLEHELAQLSRKPLNLPDPSQMVGVPFFLAYQGISELRVMKRLAGIYCAARPELSYVAPHCRRQLQAASTSKTIRVGFLSRYFYRHTIGKLNAGLIGKLPRDRFDVTLFRFAVPEDALARAMALSVDRVIDLPADLELARRLVAEQQLDALIYTDIGMAPRTYFLAFSRLAPVQCVTWGHPVTTGLPSIDYFLSSEHLEVPDANEHYSEVLVRLPHLNTYYAESQMTGPRKARRDFDIPDGKNLYLCAQSLFKLHPDFDQVFREILRRDPDALIVLLAGPQPHWKDLIASRLFRNIPEGDRRILFLSQQSQADFLQLQVLADVLLDTFPFGGGNTSLEALAFGTPIVTLPGQFLRGRITYACYRQMDLTDCIARTVGEYVEIAIRLGTDPTFRKRIHKQILERKHFLFENQGAVTELSHFLQGAVERARTRQVSSA
jgi:predicted O-linked N-acetylglucosamine transferase (SPINDLY family)